MADKTVEKSRNAKSDLNRADRDDLMSVPGIGPAGAESILKHRGDRGGFKSMDELSDVTGIGAQAVQNLRKRFNPGFSGWPASEVRSCAVAPVAASLRGLEPASDTA
jgi:competence ComEA-like helix-hairpin-helix protein